MAPQGKHSNIGQRIQALALVEYGRAHPESKLNGKIASVVSGISRQRISALRNIARQRGYDPAVSTAIKAEYVTDAPRSGRPPTIAPGGDLEHEILNKLEGGNRNDREKQAGKIAHKFGIETRVMLRFLKKHGYRSCKTTKKLGLDANMMAKRLEFYARCLRTVTFSRNFLTVRSLSARIKFSLLKLTRGSLLVAVANSHR